MKHNERDASNYKKQHDKKIKISTLAAGDRVLVRNLSERGERGKIRSHWEDKWLQLCRYVMKLAMLLLVFHETSLHLIFHKGRQTYRFSPQQRRLDVFV